MSPDIALPEFRGMGIYDRDYYRNERPFLSSYVGTGRMCLTLVLVNLGIYLAQLVTMGDWDQPRQDLGPVTEWLAMKPNEVFQKLQVWRLVTGAFLHSPYSHWHLIFNMLFLWIFGRDLEDLYGRKEFLAFYIVAGIVGNLAWGLTALWRPDHGAMAMALGASGAVMAVTVLCALHFPHRTILLMFVLPLPYWAYALLLVALDLFTFASGAHTVVGVAAHLGGAAFGAIYWHLQIRLLDLGSSFLTKAKRRETPRLRVYREEPVAARSAPPEEPRIDPQLARQADAILEKISREGKESLTPEERDILDRASAEFRKRRR